MKNSLNTRITTKATVTKTNNQTRTPHKLHPHTPTLTGELSPPAWLSAMALFWKQDPYLRFGSTKESSAAPSHLVSFLCQIQNKSSDLTVKCPSLEKVTGK